MKPLKYVCVVKVKTAHLPVNVPSLAEVGTRFPQYRAIVREDGRALYDLLTEPLNVVRVVLAANAGLAAVTGVAEIARAPAAELSSGNRLVGALVACIVEANEFQKTGRKRSIPAQGYSRGEVYELPEGAGPQWLN